MSNKVSGHHAANSRGWLCDSSGKKYQGNFYVFCVDARHITVYNKTAIDALRDVARTLYRGVLYFRNVTWFYGFPARQFFFEKLAFGRFTCGSLLFD